jgi:hypothetical protein
MTVAPASSLVSSPATFPAERLANFPQESNHVPSPLTLKVHSTFEDFLNAIPQDEDSGARSFYIRDK